MRGNSDHVKSASFIQQSQLLNSIRSMFGDHAGLGGHEQSAFGSSSGSTADSALAQRDQDQDQDQDDQEQEDQDQDQDQDQDDDDGAFGGDDTD
jgi:transcription initiation factor TFIID subunit TAF12